MDINTVQQAITSLGFPIALVIAFLWFGYKVYKDYKEDNSKREERLYQEIADGRIINSKFADIIAEYNSRLGIVQKDVEEIKEKVGA